MKALFKDPNIQAEFEERGYVILPFLNEQEINYLLQLYKDNFSQFEITGLYPTHSRNSVELSLKMSDLICTAFKRAADDILTDYQFFIGHFMVKSNVDSREFELHQDWSVVYEDQFHIAQMWCPLVDTYPQNGGLFVIPGSHKFFNNHRSGSLYRFHHKVSERTEKHILPLSIKAGYALFYHNRLIHGSFPNQSDKMRIVAMANTTSKEAGYVYYQKSKKQSDTVDIYKLDKDLLLSNLKLFEVGEIPAQLPYINSIPYSDDAISEADILKKIEEACQIPS